MTNRNEASRENTSTPTRKRLKFCPGIQKKKTIKYRCGAPDDEELDKLIVRLGEVIRKEFQGGLELRYCISPIYGVLREILESNMENLSEEDYNDIIFYFEHLADVANGERLDI